MERAKTLIQTIFDGDDVPKEDDPILKWILGDLMTTIVGTRWNIVVRDKDDKKKVSATTYQRPTLDSLSIYWSTTVNQQSFSKNSTKRKRKADGVRNS